MNKKIAVISDIHSNATSLKIVLEKLEVENIDLCIVLGDLLTYGVQPNEVIELLINFKSKVKCIFIKGNHDQFYFDIANGLNPIKYKMENYVKESILWTAEELKYRLYDCFKWQNYYKINNMYFAHANPFEYGDWTYLNGNDEIRSAFSLLIQRKMQIGIFGHTHRTMRKIMNTNSGYLSNIIDTNSYQLKDEELLIINSGSIGQPRGGGIGYIVFEILKKRIYRHHLPFNQIKKSMIDNILNTSLSNQTKKKLYNFWDPK